MEMKGNTIVQKKIFVHILAVQLVFFLVLTILISNVIRKNTTEAAISSMKEIVDGRSQIIENYVLQSEMTLTAYSRAGEILSLIQNPENPSVFMRAQEYTEKFSGDIENLEGIYTSNWDTHVLAHTNRRIVGITTRTGESLKALHNALLATDGVYNIGIILSPVSGKHIVSLYRAVFDKNGEPVGMVGTGVLMSSLISQLDSLTVDGMSSESYCILNAGMSQYIFSADSEKVGQNIEERSLKKLCESCMGVEQDTISYMEYTDMEDHQEKIAVYKYIPDLEWIIMVTDTKKDFFAMTDRMTKQVYFIGGISFLALAIATSLLLRRMTKAK